MNTYDLHLGFVASTGRTATTFMATALDCIESVRALHEGHDAKDDKTPIMPAINMEHRKAWHDPDFAHQLVTRKRSIESLTAAADGASVLVDVAYYNPPLLAGLAATHPNAHIVIIFRRCESFVRSATTLAGEDLMPVGWPPADKPLTDRERFIEFGRLKPARGYDAQWCQWSAIQKNIWLWKTTNLHLHKFAQHGDKQVAVAFYEDLVDDSHLFWTEVLAGLGILTAKNLATCHAMSDQKVNRKHGGYQIESSGHWAPAELDFLSDALQLEEEIYAARHA
jgi:hypothetical protein